VRGRTTEADAANATPLPQYNTQAWRRLMGVMTSRGTHGIRCSRLESLSLRLRGGIVRR
jgi:hypothetical protein